MLADIIGHLRLRDIGSSQPSVSDTQRLGERPIVVRVLGRRGLQLAFARQSFGGVLVENRQFLGVERI